MNVVMKIDYRFYEPNKGLEELQANLFNSVTKKYDEPPADPEQIRTQRESADFDSKTVRYAFDEQGNLLSFIQATIRPNAIYIGYPWAVDNCPSEVQVKLFDDMVQYIREQNLEKPMMIGAEKLWVEANQFIKDRNFTERDRFMRYSFIIDDLAKIEVPRYTSRDAVSTDLRDLLELMKKEPAYENYFQSSEAAEEFFKGAIEQETTLIYENQELLSAGGTTDEVTEEGVFLQFTVTNVKKMDGWKALLVHIAKKYQEKGYGNKKIIITPDLEPEQIKFYEENNAVIWSDYTTYLIA